VKDWPFAYYQRLVRELSERRGLRVLLSGTASQAARARELAQSHPRALSLAGDTDLGTFAAVLERAALFVGGDSGGAHLAAALAIPTLVIFGLTDPSRTGQTGPRVAILGGKPGEELRGGRARRVAAEELSSIGVETVWESLESLENGK
jgi:ADP-heptose:LPS heptosyltransferase